jgi:hypothetical protein
MKNVAGAFHAPKNGRIIRDIPFDAGKRQAAEKGMVAAGAGQDRHIEAAFNQQPDQIAAQKSRRSRDENLVLRI